MTHTITPPAHRYGPAGFGRPTEDPTVALRPRPAVGMAPAFGPSPVWGRPVTPSPNYYQAPIPQMAPQNPNPWGVPNAWAQPAPWAMPPAGGRSPHTQRWLLAIAGAAVVVAAVTVAVAASTGSHDNSPAVPGGVPVPSPPTKSSAPSTAVMVPAVPSAPSAPASVVSDEALPSLIPDAAYIGQVMGTTGLESIDKLSGPGMFSDDADPAQCVGVIIPANRNAYAGSGPRASYSQALHDQGSTTVFAAATTFPTASLAADFVSQQRPIWQACQSTPVRLDPGHENPMTWNVHDVSRQADTLTAHISVAGGPSCQRALMSKNNVVIDVTACNANPLNEAVTIASAISQRAAQ